MKKDFRRSRDCMPSAAAEYSAEDLKNVALQYINKMGYGNNPYMIYFHSDTENNHVHIVSTRVQKNGQKVKDNMEAVRSQKVINQIMNVDLALKAKDDISKYMELSFSTVQQYKLVLEQSGWKLREKDGLLILYKGGEKHASIQLEQIKDKAKEYNIAIVENKPLARILYHNVDIGTEIPPELYYAVAEILASVLRANNR